MFFSHGLKLALFVILAPTPAPTGSPAVSVHAAAPAAPTIGALKFFEAEQAAVLALVRKGAADAEIEARVDKFLDYQWIAQQSLGGPTEYANRCAPRCAEFEALLTRLIRESYLMRLHQADKGTLEYLGETYSPSNTQKAKVDTKVSYTTSQGFDQSIQVAYVLHWVNGTWTTRNIITDGVSLANTYLYEFDRLLRERGVDGLIARLQEQVAKVTN